LSARLLCASVVSGFTDAEARSHTGVAFRAEAEKTVGGVPVKGQILYTTGDRNGGAGLASAQLMGSIPLHRRLGLDLVAGWFRADESRNAGRNMGYEFSGNFRIHLAGPLNLDAGAAVAKLGRFFGNDTHTIYEVFSRLQLQY
jgi:hypothetical protein